MVPPLVANVINQTAESLARRLCDGHKTQRSQHGRLLGNREACSLRVSR